METNCDVTKVVTIIRHYSNIMNYRSKEFRDNYNKIQNVCVQIFNSYLCSDEMETNKDKKKLNICNNVALF